MFTVDFTTHIHPYHNTKHQYTHSETLPPYELTDVMENFTKKYVAIQLTPLLYTSSHLTHFLIKYFSFKNLPDLYFTRFLLFKHS